MSFEQFFQIYATASAENRSRIEEIIETPQGHPFSPAEDHQRACTIESRDSQMLHHNHQETQELSLEHHIP